MRTIHRDIVSAVIFSRDGKILMGRKDPASGAPYAECWIMPGGGVEEGETKLEALQRELKEETGLDIIAYPMRLLGHTDRDEQKKVLRTNGEHVWCKMQFYNYRVELNDKDAVGVKLEPVDEFIELKWFAASDLPHLKLAPPSVKLFKSMELL